MRDGKNDDRILGTLSTIEKKKKKKLLVLIDCII